MRLTRIPTRLHHHRRPAADRLATGPAQDPCRATSHTRPARCCGCGTGSRRAATPPTFGSIRGRGFRRALVLAGAVLLALLTCGTTAHADAAVLALAGSVDEVLTNIRNWLMGILAGLATVFLTIGGVRRVFGGGDPGEHEKSKEAFKAAGIGYALAALAPLVVTVLKGIVGA